MGKKGLCESDCNVFKGAVSPEQIDERDFLYVEKYLQKVKVNWKFLGRAKLKMGLVRLSRQFKISFISRMSRWNMK